MAGPDLGLTNRRATLCYFPAMTEPVPRGLSRADAVLPLRRKVGKRR